MNKKKTTAMSTKIKLPNEKYQQEEIVEKAINWALMHGMCMRSKTNYNKDVLQFAPFILLPSPFPRKEFEDACKIQTILNLLIHRVAHDYEFLKETLQETIKVDSFTRKLFNIYETVSMEGFTQKICLGLFRSDLMLDNNCPKEDKEHSPYCCWKQVEINTIASGFGWLGPASTKLHKFVLQELGYMDELNNLPENNTLQELCSGMIEAWKIYADPKAVILFVIEDITYNICDQCFHEFEIKKQNANIKVIRRTLTEISTIAKLGPNKELLLENYTVAVVYYRCGYEPAQYPTEKEWNARLLMETSLAIKCPPIQYHLAGTKKVQQAVAKPGVLARFFNDANSVEKVKQIFTGLYSLDLNEHGDEAIEMGIKNPECFVLKPQREGGSNNMYGSDIRDFLISIKHKYERVAWILMDRINPPIHFNYMIRPGGRNDIKLKELVSELGIFGVIIADHDNIFINNQSGHMLRTKVATANEGGVVAGLALTDVIYAIVKYEVSEEIREIFFFREGTVVMWNFCDLECGNILKFLKRYEHNNYSQELIHNESESMAYTYIEDSGSSRLKDGNIVLATDATRLEKYSFSSAIALSVKLGIWEASLDQYIDSIEFVTEDLKTGKRIRMSQQDVLRKQGELFALKHLINLSSDLLDTPDFYWERDDLEKLYQQTRGYFSISKRTRVINEKLSHCIELISILSSHVSDRHHIRLEWMIIILIMVEVVFEILHYLDRYLA